MAYGTLGITVGGFGILSKAARIEKQRNRALDQMVQWYNRDLEARERADR